MSAFDALFALKPPGCDGEYAESLWAKRVQDILDWHAHELAEEIRAFVGPESYPHEENRPLLLRYVKGWRDAADLIDPKVKK